MAFTRHLCNRAAKIKAGDLAFIYQTKRLLGDVGRITALTEVKQDIVRETVKVGTGLYFACWCPLHFINVVEPKEGFPLAPLVPKLEFIRRKEFWPHYLRSGLVRIPGNDGQLLREQFDDSVA